MDLIVPVEKVATKLGLTAPLTGQQEATIRDAIEDAQADVAVYLNRESLTPRQETITGLTPDARFPLTDWRAWQGAVLARFDDTYRVVATTLDADGTYTVTFDVGLDGAKNPAVVRYVATHAAESCRHNAGLGQRVVTSYSAEGQSLSYEKGSTEAGAPGALPKISTLLGLRRFAVHKPDRPVGAPWPMTSPPVGWDPR